MARKTQDTAAGNGNTTPAGDTAAKRGRKPDNGLHIDDTGLVTRTRVLEVGRVEQKTKGDLTRWFHSALPDNEQYQGVGYKTKRDAAEALAKAIDKTNELTASRAEELAQNTNGQWADTGDELVGGTIDR